MYPIKRNILGMTLIELTMTVGLMAIVMGALFTLSLSLTDTVQNYNATMTATDEARRALQILIPRLSHASRQTVNWNELPGTVLRFRMPTDLDGNGTCVDVSGNLELGNVVTVQRDTQDANNDGMTDNQLVMIQGNNVTVLANHLFNPPEVGNPDGTFNDTNGNGRLDRGFFITIDNNTIQVHIDTVGQSRRGHQFVINVEERVVPRNP
ncbi:MAG: PilW family protein [Candidatus Hydrogenedens sp.]